jgi:sugar phosphate isomerase/epimerase
MPEYSVSSMYFHEYKINEIFEFASDAGCSSMEFWLETPDFWLNGLPVENLKEIITQQKKLRQITVHSPVLDLNPCSVNPDVAEVSIESAEKSIKIAEEIDAHIITIHPGKRTAKRPPGERDKQRLCHYLQRVKKTQEEKEIKVAIENMQPKVNALLYSTETMEEILENEKWLYFTFDIAHAIKNSKREAIKFVDLFFEKIENIHVSGVKGEKTHTLPKNCGDTKEVLIYLSDCGYNKHLTLEIEDLNFKRYLDAKEKITLLTEQIEFMENIFES